MTEEELKKAMSKVIIVTIVILVIMVVLAVLIFNNFGKSSTIFKSEEQKAKFENVLENKENENITENDIAELENSNEISENLVVNPEQTTNAINE